MNTIPVTVTGAVLPQVWGGLVETHGVPWVSTGMFGVREGVVVPAVTKSRTRNPPPACVGSEGGGGGGCPPCEQLLTGMVSSCRWWDREPALHEQWLAAVGFVSG